MLLFALPAGSRTRMSVATDCLYRPGWQNAIRVLRGKSRASRRAPVDPLQQHRQLRRRERHHAALGPRPEQLRPAQSFIEKAQPVLTVPQDLDPITATASEDEDLPRVRVVAQPRLHQRRKSIEALAHVGASGRQPDPPPAGKPIMSARAPRAPCAASSLPPLRGWKAADQS